MRRWIAARNLGNEIWSAAGCARRRELLIATEGLLPITGEMRRDVGLLGSPAFEIPAIPSPIPSSRR